MNVYALQKFLDRSNFKRFHYSLLFCCLFIISFEGYDLVVYGSVVPTLIKEWSLSPVQAGVIGSYGLFGMMFGSIILSSLADRFGRKKLLIVSVIFFSSFTTISGFANGPVLFSWCRFLAGIGFGGALPTVITILSEYIPKEKRNKAITLALCGNQVGGILAPIVSVLFLSSIGWRSILWFAAIPLLLIPIMNKVIPESIHFLTRNGKVDVIEKTLNKIDKGYKEKLQEEYNDSESKSPSVSFFALFKNKLALSTFLFCAVYFMSLLMIYGLNTWLPKLMEQSGYPLVSSLGFAISLNGGALIGTIILGVMADRKGSKKLLMGMYILGAVCLALLGIKSNSFLLYSLVSITGVCTMGAQSLLNAFVSQYYPNDVRSTGIGLANGIGRLGGMLGPTLGGMLLSFNIPITLCFIAFALPGLFASIFLIFVKKSSSNESLSYQESMKVNFNK
ncbi:MFS transporter, AAHS family, benzoate transport protein [Priestia aryabhattai B8W22]|uniref:MFS transporter n=1 Tax=Priestia aryabhattai TaxID=412384 RepID=UPI00088E9A02|nr:MFS transporter, AAHS family, benzoate transport protein [Priestia aryabhattai B8W22]